ncbi:MAG TPA: hypothetical protein EYP49_09125 [Anaerolineae bacterium]|nr:hypothetical protein [Anaerolineae bacterium]
MLTASVVGVYELLKPRIGEQEAKSLLHFIEDRTVHLVRDKIAKGLAAKEDIAHLERVTREDIACLERVTREDIAAVKEDIARLEIATKEDSARLEKKIVGLGQELRNLEWRMRIYLVAIGALIVITNPKVLDLLGKLIGLAP